MRVFNTKGELLTKISLDSESERGGQEVIFVVDTDASELMAQVLTQLKIMNKHLSAITDEEIKEG